MKYERIIFFYPSLGLGGAQLLFLRCVGLLRRHGYNAFVMDYADGYMSSNSGGFDVECLVYSKDYNFSKKDLVVFPLTYVDFHHLVFKAADFDVLFWCLHPMNSLVEMLKIKMGRFSGLFGCFLNAYKKIICQRVSRLSDSGAIAFLDQENYESISKIYNLSMSERYLNNYYEFDGSSVFNDDRLLLYDLWVGRIDLDSKYHILDYLLNEFSIKNRSKSFWVVGDGAGLSRLKEKYRFNNDISFLGEIPYGDLDSIIRGARCVFAMGTSCLEAARCKKMVFVLDVFYSQVDFDYRFEPLNKQVWPSLGTIGVCARNNGLTYDEIDALSEQSFIDLGEECFEYARKNFGEAAFLESFERLLAGKKQFQKCSERNIFFELIAFSLYKKLI